MMDSTESEDEIYESHPLNEHELEHAPRKLGLLLTLLQHQSTGKEKG